MVMARAAQAVRSGIYTLINGQADTATLSALDLSYADRTLTLTSERDTEYERYARYYDGLHADVRLMTFEDGASARPVSARAVAPSYWSPRHNFCRVVVDVLVERLTVEGFAVADKSVNAKLANQIATELWWWWQQSGMDEQQKVVYTQTLTKGDAFVLVNFDVARGIPTYTYHDALQVAPVYDADHRMTAAYKAWSETYVDEYGNQRTRQRITKYEPSLISKFYSDDAGGSGWRIWGFDLDSDGQPDGGVIDWRDGIGEPLGIPIVHFKNRPNGADFGVSELADAVPLQDELNWRSWAAHQGIGYEAMSQKYVFNVKPPPEGWVTGPDQVWFGSALNPAVPIIVGQFPAGSSAGLDLATNNEVKLLAAMTGTPVHLLLPEGALPSGESLRVAEARLIAKAEARQVAFGAAWSDVVRLGIRLYNRFSGQTPYNSELTISSRWKGAATRSELTDAQVTALIGGDISQEERLRRNGYSDEQIVAIKLEQETAAASMAAVDAAFAQMAQQAATETQGAV